MGKDNSITKSELRKQVDKLNELAQKEEEKLRKVLETLSIENEKNIIMQSILEEFVSGGVVGKCEEENKLIMEIGYLESVDDLLNEEDRKQCEEIFLGDDDAQKEGLEKRLQEKMFLIFSDIVNELAKRTGIQFYLAEKCSMHIRYALQDQKVYFEEFKFEFIVDIR